MHRDDIRGIAWWNLITGGRRGRGGCLKVLGVTIVVLVVAIELLRRAG